jgi:flagellar hook-length control protein FliK
MLAAKAWSDGARDPLARERRALDVGRSEPVSGTPALALGAPPEAGPLPPSAAPDARLAARRVARQVAVHPVLRAGGTAELSLAPAELGHLRLSVEQAEGGLRVVIEAARPETADLMRRHVETLRQELRQEGLGSVGVSIGGGDARERGEAAPGRSPGEERPAPGFRAEALDTVAAPAAARAQARSAGGHIDLRF